MEATFIAFLLLQNEMLHKIGRVLFHRIHLLAAPGTSNSNIFWLAGKVWQPMQLSTIVLRPQISEFLKTSIILLMVDLVSVITFLYHTMVFDIILQNGVEQVSGKILCSTFKFLVNISLDLLIMKDSSICNMPLHKML